MSKGFLDRFTGTQLTIIVVAALAATAPGALWAIEAVSTTAITDPITNKKAEVDGQRRLRVYDATGIYEKSPPNFVYFYGGIGTATCIKLVEPAANKALIIKSLSFDTFKATATGAGRYAYVYVGPKTGCSGRVAATVNPGGIGVITVPFEPGLPVPQGSAVWVNLGSDELAIELFGSGYTVPAGQLSADAPADIIMSNARPMQRR